MKIIVAHPFKQHSFQTAVALKRGNMLYQYVTTVYLKDGNLTSFVCKFINKSNKIRAEAHRNNELDPFMLQYCEGEGLLYTFLARFPKLKQLTKQVELHLINRFGKKVAYLALKNQVDAVIMYDTTARECFKHVKHKNKNIKCILDMSAATVPGRIADMKNDVNFGEFFNEKEIIDNWGTPDTYEKMYCEELQYADAFLAASEHTKHDIMNYGISEKKIKVIPYGIDQCFFNMSHHVRAGALKLLCASGASYAKGVHHLLHVMKNFDHTQVTLTIAGTYDLNSLLYQNYCNCDNICFLGHLPPSTMHEIYPDFDVLVMPSLNDGFGFVVLEAMASGLPVIVSDHTGLCDIVNNCINGFVYKTYDENDLKTKIEYFINHIEKFPYMSKEAHKTSKQFTWESYYQGVEKFVKEICGGN